MVSIVIIGKNEGLRLVKCLESIVILIKENANLEFDVIYVDSGSSDNSIEIAKTYKFIKIIQLNGNMNAAIARNAGASESIGEIIVFIDGDMEISPAFIKHVIKDKKLIHDYVTGHLEDFFYSADGEYIGSEPRTYQKELPIKEEELTDNGGFFAIKKDVWKMVNGMKNKYRKSQDLDLTLRLSGIGIKIIRIPFLAIKHHTVDYRNENRMWSLLRKGDYFFAGVLFREHFFRKRFLLKSIRVNYTAILFALTILSLFFNSFIAAGLLICFFIILTLRVISHSIKSKGKSNRIIYFIERWFLQIVIDICFWVGFLFYYPRNKKTNYLIIN